MPRGLAALAAYLIPAGGSLLLLLQLCERCGMDNAYLGEVFLGLIVLLMGVLTGLLWLVGSRRDGVRGLIVGGVPGLAVGAAIVSLGATRMLVPPALSVVELVLLVTGAAVTVVTAGRRPRGRSGDASAVSARR